MPIGPNIAVIGAGSLSAAGPTLATLFGLPLDHGCRLSLYDSNAELLDLFDRVARAFAGVAGTPITILATSDVDEALESANTVVLCMEPSREPADAPVRAGLQSLAPTFEAVNVALKRLDDPLVINLVQPTEESGKLLDALAFHVDWPPMVPDDLAYASAHRALRWVRADEPAFVPLNEFRETPLSKAILDARPAPENRFDTSAAERFH